MNDWVEFRHFRYLLAIVEHDGFRAAAEYLHTAQPNLSVQVKQFQDLSGLRFFRRLKDGRVRLTRTGRAVRTLAQGLFDHRDDILVALHSIEQGEIRSFKFGCSPCVDRAVFHVACEMHKDIVPECTIWPEHENTVHLLDEIRSGEIDAAILTLPVSDMTLCVEELRRNRLVACLRRDHPHANKPALQIQDLQENLAIFYHPQLHPEAHARLMEFLSEAGICVDDYSRASHPSEMQELVKQRYGFALIREGQPLDAELTTRPIAGVDWTVDTAIVYRKQSHLKTVPLLVRHLKKHLAASANKNKHRRVGSEPLTNSETRKHPSEF